MSERSNDRGGSWDEDPTGIHELLSSLPDPGPMPEDLAERIRSRIETEGAAPVIGVGTGHRLRPATRHLLVAAAALVVVAGAGAAIAAQSGIDLGSVVAGGTAHDSSASQAEGVARPGPSIAGDSSAQVPSASQELQAGPVVLVIHTGRAYDSSDLASGARDLVDDIRPGVPTAGPDTARLGAVSDPAMARACADAVGIPADAPLVVDLATVDGRRAAVLLVGEVGAPGPHTAYAVGRSCSPDDPRIIAGPVTVR